MKFSQKATVTGIKKAKGEFEGTSYDSTTIFIQTDLDDRSGNAVGKATTAHKLGSSAEFDKFKSWHYPADVDAEFEMVTSGKDTKLALVSIKLVAHAKAQ